MSAPTLSSAVPARTGGDLVSGLALAVGIVAVSTSGPLIAYAAAPALAIAFWRNALALPLLAPAAALRRRTELRELLRSRRREGVLCVLAGLALAGHFMAWVPSTKMTSIATSIALVATQPVWVGLIAVAIGRRLSGWTWVGIATAVLGAMAATGVDFATSRTALIGDLLALLGGVLGAVYTMLGERVRATVSTTTYTTVCYGVCALVLLLVCLAFQIPLTGYPTTAWVAILAVTVGPQLLGHSLFNFALRRVSAPTVSVLILLETPGAALLAWAWLGQVPAIAALPGLVLLVVGVAIVALKDRGAATQPAALSLQSIVDDQRPTAVPLAAQSLSASSGSVARGEAGWGRPST
jgi:drug/metabolite transporter (DMT)-like permease